MKYYPTDLTDSQWMLISDILNDNRKRKHSLREIFNAIFYMLKTGCQWRMLPKCFPKWELVYYYFSKWKSIGVIEQIHESTPWPDTQTSGKEWISQSGMYWQSVNYLKYWYIKMVGGINAEEFSNLEDMFHYNKDKELIREIIKKVEEHERNKDEEKKATTF